MADQPVPASAPLTAEGMQQEDAQVNPQNQPQDPDTAPPAPPPDESLDMLDDGRASVYDSLDRHNKNVREKPHGFLAVEDSVIEAQGTEETPPSEPSTPETLEAPEPGQPVILSRAEFLEVFKDFRIKDKMAGEDVEAPVTEWVKASGLEKHLTKKIMEVSRKEREVLERYQKLQDATPKLTEEQIQEKYDELASESPYKAKKFLESLEAEKAQPVAQVDEAERARSALNDFTQTYPEITQDDWNRMNNPAFWRQHPDIVQARDRKEWFPVFVLAYNHLQNEKLETQRQLLRQQQTDAEKDKNQAINRKREGQVLRTSVQPKPKPAQSLPKYNQEEDRKNYIRQLQKSARERMRID